MSVKRKLSIMRMIMVSDDEEEQYSEGEEEAVDNENDYGR